jgi:hypothetical protein
MTVKIIPITPEYREGWDSIDWNGKHTPYASTDNSQGGSVSAPQGVTYTDTQDVNE